MAAQPPTHVLIATDGSSQADEAARFVRSLVNPSALSRITIVAVVRPLAAAVSPWGPMPVLGQQTWDSLEAAATKTAEDAVQRAAAELADLAPRVETLIRRGVPADEIVRAAEEFGADLIVVGSRGWGEVRAVLLGSVSERVLHRAHCPVLVVRPSPPSAGDRPHRPGRGHRFPSALDPPFRRLAPRLAPVPVPMPGRIMGSRRFR